MATIDKLIFTSFKTLVVSAKPLILNNATVKIASRYSKLVVFTNRVEVELIDISQLEKVVNEMLGADVEVVFYFTESNSNYYKFPNTGLACEYAETNDIDLRNHYMICDSLPDLKFAKLCQLNATGALKIV